MSVVGEVIYLHLYDLGGHLNLASVRKTLNVTSGDLRRERKVPSYLSIRPEPLSYELAASEIVVRGVPRQMRIEARMHSVGALSILFRIQFQVASDTVSSRRMFMLEAFMVLLFLFEVCVTVLQLLR